MLARFYHPFEKQLKQARQDIEPVKSEEKIGRDCPTCGKPLVIRYGRFGKFIGCSDYPTCRYTEPYLERMGIRCPVCGEQHGGELVVRRSKRGKTFYGCNRYPECDFTSWRRPLPQPCPNCGGLLVETSRKKAQCQACQQSVSIDTLPESSAEAV
jgi:DNA topoisomerase-1